MDMDSDSDVSERWEDFFGTSIDLAPSLLGIYDTLTNSLSEDGGKLDSKNDHNVNDDDDSNKGCRSGGETSKRNSSSSCQSSQLSDEPESGSPIDEVPGLREERDGVQLNRLVQRRTEPRHCGSGSQESLSSSTSSLSLNSGGSRRNNQIRVLSPNVQRIITHADAEPVQAVDIEALQQPSIYKPPTLRYVKKFTSPTLTRPKFSNIPLSKIAGKLTTQSGNPLVETFNTSSEYINTLGTSNTGGNRKAKDPPTPAIISIPGEVDEDKTPTNKAAPASPFTFDSQPRKLTLYKKQESIKLIEMEQLAVTSSQLMHAKPATPNIPPTQTSAAVDLRVTNNHNNNNSSNEVSKIENGIVRPKEFIATEPLSPVELLDTINFDVIAHHIQQLTMSSLEASEPTGPLVEAVNKPVISKTLVRSCSAVCASTIGGSPLRTYSRSKGLAKANTLGGAVPVKLPTAEQLAELEEANKLSAESLDRLTDITPRFAHKDGRRLSELARLNNRPLSSSSICSTSSSSSSGSDQLNGKLAVTTYLASVESLAESENDLGDPHSGLTVLERACLEIVDSERSFVEDLGQVIRGYLMDWKERACLRLRDLQTLFANIEDIYEFNLTLYKRLTEAGMDPGQIARCFIDLRERFDVYTTYCTSYPEAISLLTKLLQATHTNSLLASTQKLLQHRLPLGSYLLKPVQRILKYHLLLDSLRKHCDVPEVAEAYDIMRKVAYNIDQVKRKQEQQSRVKELSGILDGWLGPELTVLGELRLEGLLMENGKPRLVFLFGLMLIITKQKEDGRLQFKSFIHQNNLMLSEHLPGEPTSFNVIPFNEPRNQIKLTARNRDQKRDWTQHIKSVMLEKLDIPLRAKELVYQLGNEEDRTPDRSTWKWSLSHSSSTPTYLERRNACRRSEIRNRNSKFKRKTFTNSSSIDSFNESIENTTDLQEDAPKPSKPVTRNNSLDDTALQKLAAVVRYRSGKRESRTAAAITKEECKCPNMEDEPCLCLLRDQRSRTKSPSPVFSYKSLKERSKSVPRIGFSSDDHPDESEPQEDETSLRDNKVNFSERKLKAKGLFEVKQYNHKTIPKRIATLKKQRCSKKETSKFYMDLSEFDSSNSTVLKITESTEDLQQAGQSEVEQAEEATERDVEVRSETDTEQMKQFYEQLSPAEKSKRDAQIILDLLKNNKEFERIYNKQQQKRRDSNPSSPLSPSGQQLPPLPPRPPSRSPPPLDVELERQQHQSLTEAAGATNDEEPIYETLLRNVHVPYKFSPVLGRSKAQLPPTVRPREKKPRPESDYVTLVYSPDGVLQRVGDEVVTARDSCDSSASSSTSTVKRDSQSTVINLALESSSSDIASKDSETIYARAVPKNLMKRLLSNGSGSGKASLEHVGGSEISLLPRALKSIDNLSMAFGRTNRPPERRVSDVSEMCRQSILHRQGSEAVGERMAHVDYADPKTLFGLASNSEVSLQRDSVFSLTSSSDSMCGEQQQKRSAGASPARFEYERDVENNLENDFRDSAIYSDDNEKRIECEFKRPSSPPPPPPVPARTSQLPLEIGSKPMKPTLLPQPVHVIPKVIVCQAAPRSWVLQQIENFNK